jgi:putative tricarboxylic transport membrane protein
VLGVILAPIIEFSFRQALAMSGGSYAIFVERPISAIFLVMALIMILLGLKPLIFKKQDWRDRLTEAEKGCDVP